MPSRGPWFTALVVVATAPACESELSRAVYARNVCGNGVVEIGEECDDGNRIDGDDCSNECVAACPPGFELVNGACVPLTCTDDAECGTCQRCESGACVPDPTDPDCQCTGDVECGPCEACENGACVPAWGRPGCECTIDDDCDPCERCTRATCVTDLDRPGCRCNTDRDCDDLDPCTGQERCVAGVCAPGQPVACGAPLCHVGICINFGGVPRCVSAIAEDDTVCAPDDLCGSDYRCRVGRCEPAQPVLCETEPCARTRCDPRVGCVSEPEPNGAPCSDGDPCTLADACDGIGHCIGTPRSCPEQDGNPCTLPACEWGACTELPVEGQPCETDGDSCSMGFCVGGICIETPGCDDGFGCTNDTCDANGGCVHTPVHSRCDDGEPCTHDVCNPVRGDPVTGCATVRDLNFTPCDDGDPSNGADFCFGEVCVGVWLEDHDPGSACTCSCSTWETRDFQYRAGEFLLLINRHFDADPGVPGCGKPVDTTWVYELWGRSDLIATDSTHGVGHVLDFGHVLGATTDDAALLGVLNVDNSVRWTGTPVHGALPQQSGPLLAIATDSYGRPSRHNAWFAGEQRNNGHGLAAHCERSATGGIVCERVFDEPQTTVVGLASSGRVLPCPTPPCERIYDGAMAAANRRGGGAQVYFDAGRDFSIETPGPTFDRAVAGALTRDGFGHEVFLYGDGLLVYCVKDFGEELWACEELVDIPFIDAMQIHDGTRVWDQDLVFAARIPSSSGDAWINLLLVLPRFADPLDATAWRWRQLPGVGEPGVGGPALRAVEGSRDTLYAVGDNTATGHVVIWSFEP
jgi:hypothetical protein